MPASNPLRLDQALMDAAAREADIYKRSVPRQIEYWAEIGRAVAQFVDPVDLNEVRQGLARLSIEPFPSAPVQPGEVFSEIERLRQGGQLSSLVSTAPIRYQASTRHPGYLEQIRADGKRVVGRFSSGTFVKKR